MNVVLEQKQAKQESLSRYFRAMNTFMLRTPVLSLELVRHLSHDREEAIAQLARFAEDPVVREALLIASPTLVDSLPHLYDSSHPRKREQAAYSFLRYWLRMVSRPTPFGLFSGVATGQFSDAAHLGLSPLDAHRKRTRPDMEWLLQVIDKLENDLQIVRQLQVQTSGMLYRQGSRLVIPYVTRYGQKQSEGSSIESVSVRMTPVVELVLRAAAERVSFQELCAQIQDAFPEATTDVIENFLAELLRQEMLITSLRPPTTIASPLAHVLGVLESVEGIDEVRRTLRSIEDKITQYDRSPLGAGEQLLRQVKAEMADLATAKAYLQVDLALGTEGIQLPHSVGEQVARAAEILWRLQNVSSHNEALEAYRHEFMEKYGEDREVPLLELLDEEQGMGAPAGYEYPPSRRTHQGSSTLMQKHRDRLLMQWVAEALVERRLEIELTDEMLDKLAGKRSDTTKVPPLSLELYFTLHASSRESLEAGDFRLVIAPNPGSLGAGKTIGRFADLLGSDVTPFLQEIQELEQAKMPAQAFAEVAYLPLTGRATNVVLTPNIRPYEIPLGTQSSRSQAETIPLHDLLVGTTAEHLYLKSRRLGQEIITTTGHMLNVFLAPNLHRFMMEVSQERWRKWSTFEWGEVESSPFLPRVRCGPIVLSPATWKLSVTSGAFREQMTDPEWQEAWVTWRSRWQVPRYVFLTEADNRILLDLEQVLHREQLRKELFKQGEVKLVEMGADFTEFPVEGSDGPMLGEFVFPIVRQVSATEEVCKLSNRRGVSISTDQERKHLPGSEWLYVKLYGLHTRQNEFLGRDWQAFCTMMQEAGLLDAAYFVRYRDPEPHLRLRFHVAPGQTAAEILPHLHRWCNRLQSEGLLTKVLFDTYEPEIERYGGVGLMQTAEQVFAADSGTVAHWIALLRFGQMEMDAEMLAVLSAIDMMTQFGLSLEQQFAMLDERYGQKEYLDEFRQQRIQYFALLTGESEWQGLQSHPDGEHLAQMFALRKPILQYYGQVVRSTDEQSELTSTLENIVESVVHMHMNRLLGTDRERERKVMFIARHVLNSLLQYRKNRK